MSQSKWPDPAVIKTLVKPFEGYAYRIIPGATVIKNNDFDHLWAGTRPGRFNSKSYARIYQALDEYTAKAEFDHYQINAGLDPKLVEKHTYALEIKIAKVVYLTHENIRDKLNVMKEELLKEWESAKKPTKTQCLGNVVGKGHATAIIFPSARRKNGRNIVIFKDCLTKNDYVKPITVATCKAWGSR